MKQRKENIVLRLGPLEVINVYVVRHLYGGKTLICNIQRRGDEAERLEANRASGVIQHSLTCLCSAQPADLGD